MGLGQRGEAGARGRGQWPGLARLLTVASSGRKASASSEGGGCRLQGAELEAAGARAGVLGREGPGCRVTGSPPPQNAFGLHVPFFFFATICLVNLLFTGCCVPETKGRSLEQIESFFRSGRRSFLH